jgi:predicted RNA-binding Zn-ribbon protein involved in translation (DUF1610 family)
MIVRCGRCQSELDVAGAGEFVCPRCGTRNVVRAPATDPYALPNLAPARAPSPPDAPNASIKWLVCPSCSYRFAAGVDVEQVDCPNCGHQV